ncbi:MAG: FAD-dependent oxidoreductase, partial [Clostridiales bacterium]|nr:FAD-dependent oxidoreductase [Clostridiales bacterium]
MQTFDIAVIGGGPGGYTAALRAVTGGKSVVLFEGEEVGGTCLNKGCIPTKALLSMAKRYAEARENGGYISYSELAFDLEKADEIKNSRVAKLHENLTKYLASSKIVIIKAHAEFIAPNANIADSEKKKSVGGGTGEISPYFILAAGETYRSEYVVIASGSVCATPPIDGIEHAFSSDKLTKKITPAREIAVIGGGVVGLEFTSFYTAVGAKVTMILMEEKPLITYEKDISQTVGMLLKKKGVSIYGNSVVKKIEKTEAGFCVRFESAGEEKTVECDTVIDASGRRAVTEGLGLEKVGILYDKKGIYTDENM